MPPSFPPNPTNPPPCFPTAPGRTQLPGGFFTRLATQEAQNTGVGCRALLQGAQKKTSRSAQKIDIPEAGSRFLTALCLELRGKAGGCARVTAGPKRPHLGAPGRIAGAPPLWQLARSFPVTGPQPLSSLRRAGNWASRPGRRGIASPVAIRRGEGAQRKRCRDPRCSPRGTPACRGTFGGRRKAVRDRLALQGGTGDFP